jgi:hypothetical protein
MSAVCTAIFPASDAMIWKFIVISVDAVAVICISLGFIGCVRDSNS